MFEHHFIFKPVQWLGEGIITLSLLEEDLDYFTRWKMGPADDTGIVECTQEIQIKGMADIMVNRFTLKDFQGREFVVEMENPAVGTVQGKGIIDEKVIGWEFRVPEIGFEGFEYYEKIQDDMYTVKAEYASEEGLRSHIEGKIWIKIADNKKIL